eukprot:scaffold11198_cov103-Skeletonema_dohrnii-CCMP3373.AAC.13
MSAPSYSQYMRPQDRDGNNHASGRGRSQHLAPSRGSSRERSYDSMSHRRDNRNMRGERRDQYHRSRSSDYAHSRGHRSRSFAPHPFPCNYSSSSNYSSQRNSSYHDNSSRKRSRSPSRPNHHNLQNNEYDRPRSQRNFGDGRPKDTRYERRPLAPTNGNRAEMHRAPANEFHRNMNTENYHSHYYPPQSRYDHSKNTSYERRPLASRQDFSSKPTQRNSTHLFNSTHTIHELIQIACSNLATLKPSLTAAFWNKVLKQMSGRNASNSRLPNHHDELGDHLNQIFEHTQNKLRSFSAKDLSQTIYSLAKIVDVLRKHGGRRRGDDIIDVLSRLLLNHDKKPKRSLFLSFAIASRDKLDHFDARCLSNIAYAYALIKYVPEFDYGCGLFDHIATQAALRCAEFNAQGISNMMWAYATVGKQHALLFEVMGDQVVAREHLGEFIPQHLSNIMWAYATAQVPHPKLFKKVADAAIRSKGEFDSQAVVNLLWAYATMGIIDKQLFVSFVPTAGKLIDSYNNQELANMAWAYAVANVDALTLFNHHFINKCVEKGSGFEIEHYRQLYQWHLWQTKQKSNPGLPIDFQERCHEAFLFRVPRVSKLQEDVVAQLSSIGLEPKEEVLLDSGYRIDALVEVSGKTIGIEVDGQHHFIGKGKSPLAKTILKRRQVPLIDGIKLLSVPYWNWDKLGKDQAKKQEYLRHLLGLKIDNE